MGPNEAGQTTALSTAPSDALLHVEDKAQNDDTEIRCSNKPPSGRRQQQQQQRAAPPQLRLGLASLRLELARYLELATDQLLDRLFVALSTLPDNTDDELVAVMGTSSSSGRRSARTGLTIPAGAVAWIAAQLFHTRWDHPHDEDASEHDVCWSDPAAVGEKEPQQANGGGIRSGGDRFLGGCRALSFSPLCTLGASTRSRLALLPFLLCRVTRVRITSDPWPPPGEEWWSHPSSWAELLTTVAASAASATMASDRSEQESPTHPLDDADDNDDVSFWCHFLNGLHRPRVDLRVFPNCRVLHLFRVPVEWVMPCAATGRTLEVLRVDETCIFDLHRLFQRTSTITTAATNKKASPTITTASSVMVTDSLRQQQSPPLVHQQHVAATLIDPLLDPSLDQPPSTSSSSCNGLSSLYGYPKLRHVRLSHCCLNNGSGLRRRGRRAGGPQPEGGGDNGRTWAVVGGGSSPFAHLPRLKSLCLSHNQITSERVIGQALSRSMLCLESIDLSYNRLVSFHDAHRRFGNIQNLVLSHNQLVSVDGIDRLYGLETLWLDHNHISEFGQVSGLARLPLLRSLRLEGNPLQHLHRKAYRVGVLDLFRERRLAQLPSSATYGQLQKALPLLDEQLATLEELVALRQRTFVPTVVDHVPTLKVIITSDRCPLDTIRRNGGTVKVSNHVQRRGRRNAQPVLIYQPGNGFLTEQPHIKRTATTEAVLPPVAFSVDDVLLSLSDPLLLNTDQCCRKPEDDHDLPPDTPIDDAEQAVEQQVVAAPSLVNVALFTEAVESERTDVQVHPENLTAFGSHRHDDSDVSLPTQVQDDDEAAEAAFGQLNQSPIRPGEGDSELTDINNEAGSVKPGLIPLARDLDAVVVPSRITSDPSERSEPLSSPPASVRLTLRVVSFPDNVWTDDPNPAPPSVVAVPSSPTHDEANSARKFQLAEENSVFEGPSAYKDLRVADNLDLYFRLFVFGKVSDDTARALTSQVEDDDKDDWRGVLAQYPRVQLWPLDRRLRETLQHQRVQSSSSSLGPKPVITREEFKCVWKERVVACGRSALRRLTPSRAARYGFHGELLWSAANTTHLHPETIAECRDLILCCSDQALYFILDYDSVTLKTKDLRRKFPLPMPDGAAFRDAVWPHCLARHPFETLRGITIGFGFQRITLHFSDNHDDVTVAGAATTGSPSASGKGEYTYVLLTSNKMETIKLLKLFQQIAQECRESSGVALAACAARRPGVVDEAVVRIENDDRHVLDALGVAVAPDIIGVVHHYQILQQRWRGGDRGAVRRVCVVTDTKLFLLDEDYVGDGSSDSGQTGGSLSSSRPPGEVSYRLVDSAELSQVKEVHAADVDPKAITIVIRPLSKFQRTHNWRLLCRDGVGAERLVDDVRKAAASLLSA